MSPLPKSEVIILDEEVIVIGDDESDEEDCVMIGSENRLAKSRVEMCSYGPQSNISRIDGFHMSSLTAFHQSGRALSNSDKSSSGSSAGKSPRSSQGKSSQSSHHFSASPSPVPSTPKPLKLRGLQSSIPVIPPRNPPIVDPFRSVDYVSIGTASRILCVGDYVEKSDGDFMHVRSIIRDFNDQQVTLRGYRLQRCSAMNGILEKKLNELCLFYEYESNDPRNILEQCIEEVSLSEVKWIRDVRLTNQQFPHDRNMKVADYNNQIDAATNGGLTVRWKFISKYASADDRNGNRWYEKTLEHIRESERSETQGSIIVSDSSRRFEWRGETVPGGAFRPPFSAVNDHTGTSMQRGGRSITSTSNRVRENAEGVKAIDLEQQALPFSLTARPAIAEAIIPLSGSIRSRLRSPIFSRSRSDGQMLTFGDAFCGAGGTTRGAVMAGLKPIWGFDHCPHACASWRENFPGIRLHEDHSSAFVQHAQQRERAGFPNIYKVDILHLSPPCQFFSVAHSVNGPSDDANIASLYAVRDVIEVAKPRVVTLEQTFGLSHDRHSPYLNSLIHMFSSLDFSLRWAVQEMPQWGLPQRRRRLLIIAACPGEILPEFPAPSHSPEAEHGLKPYVTVNSILRQIPRNAPHHDPASMRVKDEIPWDGDSILPRSMTTHGGQNHHPSGKRDFTLREYASLQGFPMNHVFVAPYIRKQVGNAVPPCIAKVLFESIKKQLDEADGITEEHEVVLID